MYVFNFPLGLSLLLFGFMVISSAKASQSEEELIQKAVALAKEKVLRDFQETNEMARRDAHPKGHGCVKAEFIIESNLPSQLKQGIFRHVGESFTSIIRFSNGAGFKPDWESDTRGMGIKILGVPGEKVSGNPLLAETQDFLMVTHPVFIARHLEDYVEFFQKVVIEGSIMGYFFPSANPFSWRVRPLQIAREIKAAKHSNLLEIEYFSMTPYGFGANENMKFSMKPCDSARKSPFPSRPGDNFLKERLVKDLAEGDACFQFMVQLSQSRLPLDDATVLWDSPYHKVAEVHIPSQSFDSEEEMDRCENMSFDPWNALKDHEPKGSLNRSRRRVYDEVSRYRHELNGREIHFPE